MPQDGRRFCGNLRERTLQLMAIKMKYSIFIPTGCPLTVNVTVGSEAGDASKVVCSGAGLQGGVVGREIRSWIDTRRAGPGELTAHCTGPNKVSFTHETYNCTK